VAAHTVKTTYSLDLETARCLDDLARRWNVSKSEALRRAIRAASARTPAERLTPIEALDHAQRSLGLTPPRTARWAATTRAERRARSRRHEARGRQSSCARDAKRIQSKT
jgi:predicted transcriptional regulator